MALRYLSRLATQTLGIHSTTKLRSWTRARGHSETNRFAQTLTSGQRQNDAGDHRIARANPACTFTSGEAKRSQPSPDASKAPSAPNDTTTASHQPRSINSNGRGVQLRPGGERFTRQCAHLAQARFD
jgi:hypothetical protein